MKAYLSLYAKLVINDTTDPGLMIDDC